MPFTPSGFVNIYSFVLLNAYRIEQGQLKTVSGTHITKPELVGPAGIEPARLSVMSGAPYRLAKGLLSFIIKYKLQLN